MGYDKVSKSYVYCTWYDVEKDNPANYNKLDSNDAYALKCVFYFREPVSATFRVILKNEGEQVAVKTVRLDEKVIAEAARRLEEDVGGVVAENLGRDLPGEPLPVPRKARDVDNQPLRGLPVGLLHCAARSLRRAM